MSIISQWIPVTKQSLQAGLRAKWEKIAAIPSEMHPFSPLDRTLNGKMCKRMLRGSAALQRMMSLTLVATSVLSGGQEYCYS
jgi:hypothetical protein